MRINDNHALGRVDSGSDAPIVGIKTLKRSIEMERIDITPTEISIRVADNRSLCVLGSTNINLQIGRQIQELTILVVEEDLPFLIDYATLKTHRLIIDPDTDELISKETGKHIAFQVGGHHDMNLQQLSVEELIGNIEKKIKTTNTEEKYKEITKIILLNFRDCFGDLKKAKVKPIAIPLDSQIPIRSKLRPYSMEQQKEISTQIKLMLEKDIIRESTSPYASPVILAKKKDGSARFCVDFRRLNKHILVEQCPIPRIDELILATKGNEYFISLDCTSGF